MQGAVSRLQGEGRRLAFLPGRAPEWTEDQKRILATLLGTEIIDQCLQSGTNRRTDSYGGSVENRLRFPLEIMRRMGNLVAGAVLAEQSLSGPVVVEGLDFSASEWEEPLD